MACACTGTSDKRLQAIRNEADQELRRGNFDAAQRVVERGLAAAPADSAWAWTFKLSQAEILVERRQDAEALLSAALPAGPAFDPLRSRQKTLAAQNLLLSGQPRKALPLLAEASTLAPDGSELQLEIRLLEGQAKLRVEQNEQTLKTAIDQAAARGDTFRQARGWNNLGLGKYNAGRWDEAALQFERALAFTDLTPMTVYATALNNAGMCYARLGDFDRAVAVQERAVKFYSTHGRVSSYADALGELANTYIQMGEPEQAVPLYRQALTVAKDADLTVAAARNAGNLAAANVALGRWDEAERSNEEARRLKTLAKASGLVHNQLNAAQIALGRGQLDLAARLFDSALTDPTADVGVRWYAHEGLANVALAQSNPSKAGTHFESALQLIESAQSGLLKVEFQVSFLTRLIRFYQTYVDALINQGRIERALEVADSSRGRVLAARSSGRSPGRRPRPNCGGSPGTRGPCCSRTG
jgi:tetratricopeptide (TPR) repeat protein